MGDLKSNLNHDLNELDCLRLLVKAFFGTNGDSTSGGSIPITQSGAANLATSQVTSTGTAATLVNARPTRRSVLIRNTDAANSVWVGPATVTTGNGFLIKAGESVPFTWTGLLQIIDNGSHAVVAIADEYD